MCFAKSEFYQIIKDNGGRWNDAKERPLICLVKSLEYDELYWAIPVGNYEHRDEEAKARKVSVEGNRKRLCGGIASL